MMEKEDLELRSLLLCGYYLILHHKPH